MIGSGTTVASQLILRYHAMQDHTTTSSLTELLQDAWVFEGRLLELVEEQLKSCKDSATRRLYRAHGRLTRIQRKRIAQRLEDLGHRPGGHGGWFSIRLKRLALEVAVMDVWRDETTHRMITSYGIKQVECAMYRSLLDLAESTDDEATAALARMSLEEEEATARRLLFCIGNATRSKAAA